MDYQRDLQDVKVSIAQLASATEHLRDAIQKLAEHSSQTVHIRVVGMMFAVIVLTVTGIEGAEWFFKVYLAGTTATAAVVGG